LCETSTDRGRVVWNKTEIAEQQHRRAIIISKTEACQARFQKSRIVVVVVIPKENAIFVVVYVVVNATMFYDENKKQRLLLLQEKRLHRVHSQSTETLQEQKRGGVLRQRFGRNRRRIIGLDDEQ
jgi:chlorite dismutase